MVGRYVRACLAKTFLVDKYKVQASCLQAFLPGSNQHVFICTWQPARKRRHANHVNSELRRRITNVSIVFPSLLCDMWSDLTAVAKLQKKPVNFPTAPARDSSTLELSLATPFDCLICLNIEDANETSCGFPFRPKARG